MFEFLDATLPINVSIEFCIVYQELRFSGRSEQPIVGSHKLPSNLAQSCLARYTFVREFGSFIAFTLDRLDAWPGLYPHVPDTLL
jgi:hypothetical protein